VSGGRCFFCGFEDDTVKEIGPRLAESFCQACLTLADFQGKGSLIYLPNVPQADFNLFMRTLFVALTDGDEEQRKEAAGMYHRLLTLGAPVKKIWGTQDAGLLGQALERVDTDTYQKRNKTFRGLVFMPLSKMLSREQVFKWSQNVFSVDHGLAPKNWRLVFLNFFIGK
jgi:hypothetical protein